MNAPSMLQNDSDRLLELIHGFRVSQAIYVIVALGIPDLLAGRRLSSDELAERTNAHPRALYRVLRALAAVDLVHEHACKAFSLTAIGQRLRSGVPGSRAAWVANTLRPPIWRAWEHLMHTARTGETAFRHAHGEDVWEFRAHSPADSALFDLAMREGSVRIGAEMLAHYDFTGFRHIVDIGGGDGTLISTLLAGCPRARGTVLDQSHVVAAAPEVLQRTGVENRCEIVAGNFLEAVPAGADAYLLKFILHDWDDDHCVRILENCRRAMSARSKLLIVERLMAPPNEGADGKLSDLNMMVNVGGEERTQEEFSALLCKSGFVLGSVTELSGQLALLEAS